MGRLDHAREIVTRLRVITSVVIPDLSYLQNADADRRANPSQATGARKRGDRQLHRFRVLEVRIHSPPAERVYELSVPEEGYRSAGREHPRHRRVR
jgi:hypothetical protein